MRTLRTILQNASTAAAAVALLSTGCADRAAVSQDAAEAMTVVRGDMVRTVLLTGELVAEDAVRVTVPNVDIWPVQLRWIAEDGAAVAAGESVAEFDNSQLLSNIGDLEATVVESLNALEAAVARVDAAAAEAGYELEESQANLDKARMKADVPRELFSAREFEERQVELRRTELQFEESRATRESARLAGLAEIELLRLNLARAERQLSIAYDRIEKLDLRADVDGIFLRGSNRQEGRMFQPGDSAWPGSAVGTLPDLTTLMIEAKLYDVDDGRARADQTIVATLDAFPDQTYQGRIRSIDLIAQEESRRTSRRTFRVLVDLERVDPERMRPGMSVKVQVFDPPRADVLMLPRQAVDWSADAPRVRTSSGWQVVVLGPCDAVRCVVEGDDGGVTEGARLLSPRGVS